MINTPAPQLELGPLETLSPGQSFAAPEQAPGFKEVATEDDNVSPFYGADESISDPLLEDIEPDVPSSEAQLEYAAGMYDQAGAEGLITPISVLASLRTDIGSPEISEFLDELRLEDADTQQAKLTEIISNPRLDVNAKLAVMQEMENISGERKWDVNIVQRSALFNAASTLPASTPEEQARKDLAFDEVEALPETLTPDYEGYSPEELANGYAVMLTEAFQDASENVGASDILGTMIPARFNIPVNKIYAALGFETGSGIASFAEGVLVGERLKTIRNAVEGMSLEQKVDALDKILKVLRPNGGVFFDSNDAVTAHVLSEIFWKDLMGTDYYDASMRPLRDGDGKGILSITQFLDNVGGLLDLTMVGGIAKGTIKLGQRVLPKSITRLNAIKPQTVSEIAAEVLKNPALAERMGGGNAATWAQNILPSHATLVTDGGIEGVAEIMARQARANEELLELANRTSLTMQERAEAALEIEAAFRSSTVAQPTSLHSAKSTFVPQAGGLQINAVFGRDAVNGFINQIDAREASKLLFPDQAPELLVLHGGKLIPVPAGWSATQPGKYFFKGSDFRAYDSAQETVGRLVLGGDDVATAVVPGRIGGFSLWNRWKAAGQIFSKSIVDDISTVARSRNVWSSLTENLTKSVDSLDHRQRVLLSSLLKEGEKIKTSTGRGHTFTATELVNRGMKADGIKAYYESRGAMDILFNVTNARTRALKQAAGEMEVHTVSGSAGHAVPRTEAVAIQEVARAAVTGVLTFDPVARVYLSLDAAAIRNLYANGGSVARLSRPMMGKAGEEATHVIVDASKGTQLRELGRQVINKVEGYYPHIWESNFVVYGKTKGGNRVALGLARTAKDAAAAVERVRATKVGTGKSFVDADFDFDRSLRDPAYRGQMVDDLYLNMGGPIYGERSGGLLKNYSMEAGGHMVDPVEAMVRGMELVGMNITKGELVNHMQTKLRNFMRMEGLGVAAHLPPGTMPRTADEIVGEASKAKELEKARAFLDMIETFGRLPDAVDTFTSAAIRHMGGLVEDIATKVPKWAGKKAVDSAARALYDRAAKGLDPFAFLNTLAHKLIIATNPTAHAALQSAQSLVMLGVSPRNYFTAFRQLGSLIPVIGLRSMESKGMVALMSKAEWDATYAYAAKFMGLPAAEVKELSEVFYKSGLVDAVSHNSIIRQNLRSAGESLRLKNSRVNSSGRLRDSMGRAVRTVEDATIGNLGRVGFEAGENINQMMTFLTFYNADRRAGKALLSNPDYVKSLVGRTAEMSGNMIPEAGFKYQRGFLKSALQFVGFQHKMLALMTPAMLGGSRYFTGWQKTGIVASQFLLYGRKGVPHADVMHRFIEGRINEADVNEQEKAKMLEDWQRWKPMFDGLLVDQFANAVLKELYGEGTPEFGFSERFAPGGGTEFMVERLIKIANDPFSPELVGLGGAKAGKLYDWGKRVYQISLGQALGMDDVPLDVRAEELTKSGAATAFGTYNRLLAVQAAKMEEGWRTAGGRVSQGYSGSLEGSLFALFGINTKNRDELYAARDKYEERLVMDKSFKDNELRALADQYVANLVFQSLNASKETTSEEHYQNLMVRWTREQNLLFSMLERDDAEAVHKHVEAAIIEMLKSDDDAERAFIEKLTQEIRDGNWGKEGRSVSSYLRTKNFVNDNPALMILVERAFEDAHADPESE